MNSKSYAVVRNPHNDATRLGWRPKNGTVLYCGICLRGEVRAEVGHVCSHCQSRVANVFEVIPGGKLRTSAGVRHAAGESMAGPVAKVKAL